MASRQDKPPRPKAGHPPAPSAPAAPEIHVDYTPAGRETLAVIERELAEPAAPRATPSAPSIEIREAPVGRETLAAITEELLVPAPRRQPSPPARSRLESLDESDARPRVRLSQRPRRAPQNTLDYAEDAAPVGRSERPLARPAPRTPTLRPLAGIAPPAAGPADAPQPAYAIFEMATFVVRCSDALGLQSVEERRSFVQEHLLHRLPVPSMASVDRVDVTPWTERGTVVVRVWCVV